MNVRDYMFAALLLAMACLALYVLVPAYTGHRRTRLTILQLRESLERQDEEIRELKRELSALRTDYRAIERVAREKFGLCLEGEKIYHFESPVPASAPDPTP